MNILIILEAFIVAFLGGIVFTIVGIIPGTDETATMAPLTLVLVLLGLEPVVIYAWFIGIIVAMQISHTIPTSMAALPGSTMAVPMVRYSALGKRLGIPHIIMKKMAVGSLIGSFIAVPVAVAFAFLLAPLGHIITPYIGLIFTIGAVIIAYMSEAKWAAVISLIPYSFLIQGFQKIAMESVGKTLFISIFMGITIGPMISELFNVMVPNMRKKQMRDKPTDIWLAPDAKQKYSFFPNPLKLVTKRQKKEMLATSVAATGMFTFSPVGTTVLLGELVAGKNKEMYTKITSTVATQDAVSNASYLGGIIISLLAFGIPISPVALGPGAPLFNAPPRFSVEPIHNLSNYLTVPDYIIVGLLAVVAGSLIMGIVIALCIGLFGGILHNFFEVHTGVQFMAYYASGWIVTSIMALSAMA